MDFGPLAEGFPSIPGLPASKEAITAQMYGAVLDALEKAAAPCLRPEVRLRARPPAQRPSRLRTRGARGHQGDEASMNFVLGLCSDDFLQFSRGFPQF